MTTKGFYDKQLFSHTAMTERMSKIFAAASKLKPDHVLDIGCGDGYLLWRLKEIGILGQGVDISDNAVQVCKQKGIRAFQVNVDEKNLPFDDHSFDLVVCSEVIEHLFDPDHLMDEICRVLKPKGYIILTTPNLAWWLNRIVLLFGYQPFYTEVSSRYNLGKIRKGGNSVNGHIRLFTYPALRELIGLHQFTIVKHFGTAEHLPIPAFKGIDRLLSRKTSIACNLGVLCQKML